MGGGAGPARWARPAPSLWSGYFLFALSIAAQASATALVGSVPLSITDTIAFPKLPQKLLSSLAVGRAKPFGMSAENDWAIGSFGWRVVFAGRWPASAKICSFAGWRNCRANPLARSTFGDEALM